MTLQLHRAYRSLLAVLALLMTLTPFAARAADYTVGADLVGSTSVRPGLMRTTASTAARSKTCA